MFSKVEPDHPEDEAKSLLVRITNGDYRLMRETAERLGFCDEVALLRFAFAVLSFSVKRDVTIDDVSGVRMVVSPGKHLLKTPDAGTAMAPAEILVDAESVAK